MLRDGRPDLVVAFPGGKGTCTWSSWPGTRAWPSWSLPARKEAGHDARPDQRRAPRRRPADGGCGYRVVIAYGREGFWVRNPDMTRPPFADHNGFLSFRKAKVLFRDGRRLP